MIDFMIIAIGLGLVAVGVIVGVIVGFAFGQRHVLNCLTRVRREEVKRRAFMRLERARRHATGRAEILDAEVIE